MYPLQRDPELTAKSGGQCEGNAGYKCYDLIK